VADQRMSTRQARWAVGDWILVVAPHGAILLSPEAPGTLDEDLWEQIHTDGVSLASVLDTLVMGAGGRLARIPDFGLVILGRDRVHLALRGGVVAEVDGARIDAEGVVTWYECRVASAESLALYAPGAADSAQARLHPVRDAVLPASAVHLSVGPAAAVAADRYRSPLIFLRPGHVAGHQSPDERNDHRSARTSSVRDDRNPRVAGDRLRRSVPRCRRLEGPDHLGIDARQQGELEREVS